MNLSHINKTKNTQEWQRKILELLERGNRAETIFQEDFLAHRNN